MSINKHQKPKQDWRTRVSGSMNQIGNKFTIEPHGDKSKLPKALQQVSFSEITDTLEKNRKKRMTLEELEEDELIAAVVQETIEEEQAEIRNRNLLQKLGNAIDERDKKLKIRKALEEAKAQEKLNDSSSGDGYGEVEESLEEKRRQRLAENDVFGDG